MDDGRPRTIRAPGAVSAAGMSRRRMMRAAGAGAVAGAVWGWSPPATAATSVTAAVEALLAGRTVVEAPGLRLDLPASFDQGTTVPLAVTVDSPMTEADHAVRVSFFAEGNPFPEVASVHFMPATGQASAATRIRLNEGRRQVVAVAELSDGRVWLARRSIEVATSGCSHEVSGAAIEAMPRPEPRLKLPVAARQGDVVEIRTMISHWMESGLRSGADGTPIPRRIIKRMVCLRDGVTIFAADLTPAIAANAYLSFPVVARRSAMLTFAWHEDGGAAYHASHALTVI